MPLHSPHWFIVFKGICALKLLWGKFYMTRPKSLAVGFQVTLKDGTHPEAAFVSLPARPLSWNASTLVLSDYICVAAVAARSSLKKQSLISVELTRTKIHLSYETESHTGTQHETRTVLLLKTSWLCRSWSAATHLSCCTLIKRNPHLLTVISPLAVKLFKC